MRDFGLPPRSGWHLLSSGTLSSVPPFRDNFSVPTSMIKKCNKLTGPIVCPETSVWNCHSTLRNIPAERKQSHFVCLSVCYLYDSLRDAISLRLIHFSVDRSVNLMACFWSDTSISEILWRNSLCLKFTPFAPSFIPAALWVVISQWGCSLFNVSFNRSQYMDHGIEWQYIYILQRVYVCILHTVKLV